ncbi:MAG: hypothetical protein ABI679_01640 [Gemmatimonadota bacterium]
MKYLIPALILCLTQQGTAQSVDQGTFSIRAAGREIGREEFSVATSRQGGAPGSTVISRVRIPAVTPRFTQETVLERRADGSFSAIEVSKPGAGRALAELARNKLLIHFMSGGSEAIREWPAAPNMVGLADSAYAMFAAIADLATPDGLQLTGVYPVSGRRVPFTAKKLPGDGTEGTRILLAGEITGTIWMDEAGRLTRMEFPQSGIEIVRLRK